MVGAPEGGRQKAGCCEAAAAGGGCDMKIGCKEYGKVLSVPVNVTIPGITMRFKVVCHRTCSAPLVSRTFVHYGNLFE